MNVYLDTCVLPTRRELRRGFLGLIGALSRSGRLELFVPDLVVEEFRNIRRGRAEEAVDQLRKASEKAYDYLALPGMYIPSIEEVVEPLVADLTQLVSVIPMHPEDALAGLRREALREPPARDGRGGRDAAIWLSVVRHHNESGAEGVFVTANTADFAVTEHGAGPRAPLDSLLTDLGASRERFRFVFRPFEFLEELAPRIDVPDGLGFELAHDSEFVADVSRAIELAGLGSGGRTDGLFGEWAAHEITAHAAHQLEDCALVRLSFRFVKAEADGSDAPEAEGIVWVERSPDGTRLVEIQDIKPRKLGTEGRGTDPVGGEAMA